MVGTARGAPLPTPTNRVTALSLGDPFDRFCTRRPRLDLPGTLGARDCEGAAGDRCARGKIHPYVAILRACDLRCREQRRCFAARRKPGFRPCELANAVGDARSLG